MNSILSFFSFFKTVKFNWAFFAVFVEEKKTNPYSSLGTGAEEPPEGRGYLFKEKGLLYVYKNNSFFGGDI
jgi:hypothetical protein